MADADDTLKLPDVLSKDGLLMAWSLEHMQASMPLGFDFGNPDCCPETGFQDAVMFDDRGNILTFSGQRSASAPNCLVPAALRHGGPVICLSGSSCAYLATAKAREDLGDTVIVLDPYGLTGHTSGGLNPFDLLDEGRADLLEKATNVAGLVCPLSAMDANSYAVSARAQQFLTAVLLYQILQEPPAQHTLERTRAVLFDSPNALQNLLGLLANSPHERVRQASSFLGLTPPEMLTGMLSYLQDQMQFLNHEGVVAALNSTSFDLDALADASPDSVYIVLPGHQPAAFARLGRLWLGTLLEALSRRVRRPQKNTLVLVDQAQDLGSFDTLVRANSHLGSAGVHLWTIWADAEALRETYPRAWRRFLSEAWVIQAFGVNSMVVAQELAAITGYPKPADIMDLDHDEMILLLSGDKPVIAQRVNGFTDPVFAGLIDEEGMKAQEGSLLPPKSRDQRKFIRQEPAPGLPLLSGGQLSRLLELGRGNAG